MGRVSIAFLIVGHDRGPNHPQFLNRTMSTTISSWNNVVLYRAPAFAPERTMMAMDRGVIKSIVDEYGVNKLTFAHRHETDPFLSFRPQQVYKRAIKGVEDPVTGLRKAKVTLEMRDAVDINRTGAEVFIIKMDVQDGIALMEVLKQNPFFF